MSVRVERIGDATLYLRDCRYKRGLLGKQLAHQIGVHTGTLWNWEEGHRSPSNENLNKWASALGVTIEFHKRPKVTQAVDGRTLRHIAPNRI